MFSKSLLTAFTLIAFASGTLGAPALSCAAVSSAVSSAVSTAAASSSVAVTTNANIATKIASSSAAAKTTAAANSSSSKSGSSSSTNTNSAASFGSCSAPEIKFALGLDGRNVAAFAPENTQVFNHGSDTQISTITSFICQQLKDKCKANQAALTECTSATNAANAATKGGAQADAFNKVFGINTNFASVGATSSSAAATAKATTSAAGGNKNAGNTATATSAAASSTSAAAASSSSGDEQDSFTLDPSVLATGFEQDGQATPAAGQVASLTSKNNFINFCLTVNKPITNGQQITTGSCNPAPMGVIASTANMPSSKFTNPKNFDTVKANQAFTITMAINNLETGNFVNADSNYYSAPQQVNAQGDIIGHSHVVIEQLESLNQTTPLTPAKFAFFKGINGAAVDGIVSADVTSGLPAGAYRMASINAAANHQPVLVAIAQHGSLDDMVYFTVE